MNEDLFELRKSFENISCQKIKLQTDLELITVSIIHHRWKKRHHSSLYFYQAEFDEISLQNKLLEDKLLRSLQEVKDLEDQIVYEKQNTANEAALKKNMEIKMRQV